MTLTLNRPNTGLPALLDIPILKSGTEKHSVPLGTGPYLYDESSENCLIASQNWWRHISQPVERISLTGTADQESMLYRFSSRDVQLIVADLTGTAPVAVSGSVSYDDADTTVFQYLGINVSAKGLDDAAFRRCLSLGVSRRALVSSLLSGHAKAAQFPVSPVSPLYPADLEQTDSVVAFTDALNACETRPSRTLRLLVNSENSFKVSMARQIAAAFTAAGAATETVELPWEEYTAALTAGRFDLSYGEVRLSGGLGRFLPARHRRQSQLRWMERSPVRSCFGGLPLRRKPGGSVPGPVSVPAEPGSHPAHLLQDGLHTVRV